MRQRRGPGWRRRPCSGADPAAGDCGWGRRHPRYRRGAAGRPRHRARRAAVGHAQSLCQGSRHPAATGAGNAGHRRWPAQRGRCRRTARRGRPGPCVPQQLQPRPVSAHRQRARARAAAAASRQMAGVAARDLACAARSAHVHRAPGRRWRQPAAAHAVRVRRQQPLQLQGFGAGSRAAAGRRRACRCTCCGRDVDRIPALAVRALLGRVSADAATSRHSRPANCGRNPRARRSRVALDGEVAQLAYAAAATACRPRALRVLVPRPDDARAGAR